MPEIIRYLYCFNRKDVLRAFGYIEKAIASMWAFDGVKPYISISSSLPLGLNNKVDGSGEINYGIFGKN